MKRKAKVEEQPSHTIQRQRCDVVVYKNRVVKWRKHANEHCEHEREVEWLKALSRWNRVPNFIGSSPDHIEMENRGEPLCLGNSPDDLAEQILDIVDGLYEFKVSHNDITEDELLVDEKGFISLIDWEWATRMSEDIPNIWPKEMGFKYRYNDKLNDVYALNRCFKKIRDDHGTR